MQHRPLLPMLCLVMAVSTLPAVALPQCSSTCSKWAACEIDLSNTNMALTEETLYGIRPKLTVQRLNGSGQVVETRDIYGFFYERDTMNNVNRFKARFNPSESGSHQFSITSSYAFTTPTTTFNCGGVAVLPGGGVNQGFLRSDPSFPQSFIWDSGTRGFFWGQTYYQIANLARKSLNNEIAMLPPNDSVWQTPITGSAGYRMNKVRLLVSPWSGDARSSVNVESKAFQKNSDGITLNRDKLDLLHWRAVDRVVDFLYGQGIVADLILFHDGDDKTSPFGTAAQNQKYTRYATSRYAAYPNVIWTLSNEYQLVTGTTGQFPNNQSNNAAWTDLGCLIRGGCGGYTAGADPWIVRGSFRRPLSNHNNINTTDATRPMNGSYPCFEFFTAGWANHIALQTKKGGSNPDIETFSAVARNRNISDPSPCSGLSNVTRLPIINDEYGYVGDFSGNATTDRNLHRKGVWGVVTGGGLGSAGSLRGPSDPGCFNPSTGSSVCQPALYTTWVDEIDAYGDIRRMVDLFVNNSIPFWRMEPLTNSGTGPVHTLGIGGATREYVIYSASGTSVAASGLATGGYKKTIFNPRTGATTVVNCCQLATSSASFTVSTNEDWVVWLRGKTCNATDPACAP